jgi:hypothetical protein
VFNHGSHKKRQTEPDNQQLFTPSQPKHSINICHSTALSSRQPLGRATARSGDVCSQKIARASFFSVASDAQERVPSCSQPAVEGAEPEDPVEGSVPDDPVDFSEPPFAPLLFGGALSFVPLSFVPLSFLALSL